MGLSVGRMGRAWQVGRPVVVAVLLVCDMPSVLLSGSIRSRFAHNKG